MPYLLLNLRMFKFLNLFLLMLVCGQAFASIDVELDVVFINGDSSTLQCRYLYVLNQNAERTTDTIAVFDTLSFNGRNRVSLFFTAKAGEKNMLSLVDSCGQHIESNFFKISSRRTTYTVLIDHDQQQIKVVKKFWFLPMHYLFCFLIIALVAYLLIALVGRKTISWLRTSVLVLIINLTCFVILAILYLTYQFL